MDRYIVDFNYTPQNSDTEKHYQLYPCIIDTENAIGIALNYLSEEEKMEALSFDRETLAEKIKAFKRGNIIGLPAWISNQRWFKIYKMRNVEELVISL